MFIAKKDGKEFNITAEQAKVFSAGGYTVTEQTEQVEDVPAAVAATPDAAPVDETPVVDAAAAPIAEAPVVETTAAPAAPAAPVAQPTVQESAVKK